MTDHVLSGLVQRRAEMAGRITGLQTELHQLQADLACLDAVIRQFDPEYEIAAIRPKYRKAPTPGEFGAMGRTVLDILRRVARPVSTPEIAKQMIAERGLDPTDRAMRRNMVKRVGMALRYQRTNGVVREAGAEGADILWELDG